MEIQPNCLNSNLEIMFCKKRNTDTISTEYQEFNNIINPTVSFYFGCVRRWTKHNESQKPSQNVVMRETEFLYAEILLFYNGKPVYSKPRNRRDYAAIYDYYVTKAFLRKNVGYMDKAYTCLAKLNDTQTDAKHTKFMHVLDFLLNNGKLNIELLFGKKYSPSNPIYQDSDYANFIDPKKLNDYVRVTCNYRTPYTGHVTPDERKIFNITSGITFENGGWIETIAKYYKQYDFEVRAASSIDW